MSKKLIIAIDGFSSCGKSTLAKALAHQLGYAYVDSGAMYRAVTLYFIQQAVDWNDPEQLQAALDNIQLNFQASSQGNRIFLNGVDVEDEIRSMAVSARVSPVSALPAVRRAMVSQQQKMGWQGGLVMDGRDIGTVVFPDADLKIFLTADPAVRAERRHQELIKKGVHASKEAVQNNLTERDHIDSTRADSPLRQADDALVIDNTHLTELEQLKQALQLVEDVQNRMA